LLLVEVQKSWRTIVCASRRPAGPTLEDLIVKANEYGLGRAELVTAARAYHRQSDLDRLTEDQVGDLYRRLVARMEAAEAAAAAPVATATAEAEPANGRANGRRRA
jgi:hypothetical protein